VPQTPLLRGLLEAVGEPLLGTTLQLPGDEHPLSDSDEILERLGGRIDLVLEGGRVGLEPTTVIDLTGDQPLVVRFGCGPVEAMLGQGR
jgi:tRNA A37 threonylcarbamoyladenosine synthetase subunit TsaC/SUA5/YrdC